MAGDNRRPAMPELAVRPSRNSVPAGVCTPSRLAFALQNIVVVDYGTGMTKKELNQWAQMHDLAENRKKALADEYDEAGRCRANEDPCKANGMSATGRQQEPGFVYGKDVRAVTCPKAARGESAVYELLLSETTRGALGDPSDPAGSIPSRG